MTSTWRVVPLVVGAVLVSGCGEAPLGETYDLVIQDGRVIDPETGLDGVRHVGIEENRIGGVSERPIEGRDTIDGGGLVVAPGFIDVHAHGQDDENYRVRVRDGVTTALELELGTADVDEFYREREGDALIHHGVSAGHVPVRMEVMGDDGGRLPVGPAAGSGGTSREIHDVLQGLRRGLDQGALAVGFSLQNTPGAGPDEVGGAFELAAAYGVPVHVHLRYMGEHGKENSLAALDEVLDLAAATGAALHVAHVHSSGLTQTPQLLDRISEARKEGLDVTGEVYPYTAGQTNIEGSLFSGDWRRRLGIGYEDLEWVATGERLTETSFDRLRAEGGLVILHMIPASAVREAVRHPQVLIASDGLIEGGTGHPRAAGSYSRILGSYVREKGELRLIEALRKMSLFAARRFEAVDPAMRRKGRVQEGMDADLVVFDFEAVEDRATYENPTRPPAGIEHVLVDGVPVVRDGRLDDSRRPGRAIRATRR